ncbi:MAG: ABC transporter permease [Chloroflexi bacterium]|nr:ABC transporter permease [Chloroflexota bacterium]MCH8161886.1 ABC transporter permease [Chloroflexota bacterium]
MNATVFTLTLRQFAGQRRSLLMFGLALIPVALAIIFRLGEHLDQQEETANFLANVVITLILPLACLIIGTSALGSEIEDGTAVYILAKPVPRREIIAAKFAASVLIAAAFVVPATVVSGLIGLQGVSEEGIVTGFAIATLVGVFAYTAVFILLSLATSRALLFGLAYVFIWEGLITELFSGTRFLSIRQYCLGIADFFATVSEQEFEATIGGPEAFILAAVAAAGALFLAVRRLESFELTNTD